MSFITYHLSVKTILAEVIGMLYVICTYSSHKMTVFFSKEKILNINISLEYVENAKLFNSIHVTICLSVFHHGAFPIVCF